MKKIVAFFKTPSGISLTVIILLAAFLRLYKIADYMTFLGDEGRDVLVARNILMGHLTLLGPRASAGDFFTGPIYYYFMAPFLWLFHYDPVGPAVMIALLGIITVFLTYYLGKKFFGVKAGLMAAALYAVSPLVISYSRSSWNPNPMPFFSLIILLLLYNGIKNKSWKYFLGAAFLFGIAFQLHYIETVFAVVLAFFLTVGTLMEEKKGKLVSLLKRYGIFIVGFVIGYSPFLAFEVRHGFPNTRTIINFIFSKDVPDPHVFHPTFLQIISDVFFRLFGRLVTQLPSLVTGTPLLLWSVATVVLAFLSIIFLFKIKNKLAIVMFLAWLFFGVVMFGFYKKPIYDYYFEFMFPLPFLLTGNFLGQLMDLKKWHRIWLGVSLIFFIALFVINIAGMPFRYPPNKQKDQMQSIANFVLSKTHDKPFNFALLAHGNSDHAYRYFFAVAHRDPVVIQNAAIDPDRKTATDQLLVVCEYADCQPLGNSLWEIAGFGRAQIAGHWHYSVVDVYKLTPYHGKD